MDAMLLLSIFLPDEKQASGIMKEFEQVHQIFRFCIKSEKKKNIKTNTKPSKFDNCLFASFHFILIFPIVHDDVLFHPTRSFI